MSGEIVDGWPFVWAAYSVTAAILGGYTASLLLRYRAECRRRDRDGR